MECTCSLNEDLLEEDVDNSDLAQLLPPDDEETQVEERKGKPILLNETVPQDPPAAETMPMSWILPLPKMDEHIGGRTLSLVPLCCPMYNVHRFSQFQISSLLREG